MFAPLAVTLLSIQSTSPPVHASEVVVCGRTMRFEDQYCAAVTEGRRWGHRQAAEAHERAGQYALPARAPVAYLAAANNWIAAGEPAKAVVAFDRALAAGLTREARRDALRARAKAALAAGVKCEVTGRSVAH
jgi:hypothetical protein